MAARVRLRAARGWVTARLGWRRAFSALALLLLVAGVVFVLDGATAAGVALVLVGVVPAWLSGMVVVPFGLDAYERRVTRAMWDRNGAILAGWGTGARRLQEIAATLSRIRVPARFAGEHGRIVEVLGELDEAAARRSWPPSRALPAQARSRVEFDKLLAAVRAAASDAAEHGYADAVAKARTDRDAERARMAEALNGIQRDAVRRLQRIRPPGRWATEHERMVHAFAAYAGATDSYYQVEEDDLDARLNAAREMEARWEQFVAANEPLRTGFLADWEATRNLGASEHSE